MAVELSRGRLSQAWAGALEEVAAAGPGAPARFRKALSVLGILGSELLGLIQLAPYGYRAARTYAGLKSWPGKGASAARPGPAAVSLVKDIPYAAKPRCLLDVYVPPTAGPHPVALFVHGGVWSGGERWNYAPKGVSLAAAGTLAMVAGYTLHPTSNAEAQAEEVAAALRWAQAHAADYGGDPAKLALIGHSSGAHICALALVKQKALAAAVKVFVGLCGVYDIEQHYGYEDRRGVARMSTMTPACGGAANFAAVSPACIVARGETAGPLRAGSFPACYFLSSEADVTVPWSASASLHEALLARGAASSLLLYDGIGHADFVTSWRGHGLAERPLAPHEQDVITLAKGAPPAAGALRGTPAPKQP